MDAATLEAVMVSGQQRSLYPPRATYQSYVDGINNAMIAAGVTTRNRAAMWCAQLGHESVGLKYMREIWGPTPAQRRYEGRADLGNTQSGDGKRFMGRGPIQITGRANYTKFDNWCFARGYTTERGIFLRAPQLLENPHWGFLAATWYWVAARNINPPSDMGGEAGLVSATRMINGGTNGLDDRRRRYHLALTFGDRLLPSGGVDELSAQFEQEARARWAREDALEKDLRGDLAIKETEIDGLTEAIAGLSATFTRVEQKLDQLLAPRQ